MSDSLKAFIKADVVVVLDPIGDRTNVYKGNEGKKLNLTTYRTDPITTEQQFISEGYLSLGLVHLVNNKISTYDDQMIVYWSTTSSQSAHYFSMLSDTKIYVDFFKAYLNVESNDLDYSVTFDGLLPSKFTFAPQMGFNTIDRNANGQGYVHFSQSPIALCYLIYMANLGYFDLIHNNKNLTHISYPSSLINAINDLKEINSESIKLLNLPPLMTLSSLKKRAFTKI